jgi:prepilin signal peptidase PulO-like enzyme (type II secretory pathway)
MPEPMIVSYFFAAVFGAVLASFLVHEYDNYTNDNKSVKFRSVCDHCGHQLNAFNLVPIFSFVFQLGKSSCCKKSLSFKYLFTEMALAAFFVLCVYMGNLFSLGLIIPALILLALIDEKYQEIPIGLNIFIFIWVIANTSFIENLLFAGAVALFLLTLYWGYLKYRKVEGLGLGDIILLGSVSLYLGLPYALYLITISASLLLLKIIASRRYQERHAFGSWIVLTFGAFILFQEFYGFAG